MVAAFLKTPYQSTSLEDFNKFLDKYYPTANSGAPPLPDLASKQPAAAPAPAPAPAAVRPTLAPEPGDGQGGLSLFGRRDKKWLEDIDKSRFGRFVRGTFGS
jgi:hypothetical protein